MISVRVHGITADPTTNQFLMLLIDDVGKRLLPIVIGQWEAQSIAWNMQGITMQRPLTHDLFQSFLDNTDIKLNKVTINNLKENTFYAIINLTTNGNSVELDSRPSDAVAIALRVDAPIFVENDVFERAAVNIENTAFDHDPNGLEYLKKELESAVDREDYEYAAELRDKIKALEGNAQEEN